MLTKNDLQQIGRVIKESETRIKVEIKKVQKRLEDMDRFLDKELMADRKRIIRIEEHLGFPQS